MKNDYQIYLDEWNKKNKVSHGKGRIGRKTESARRHILKHKKLGLCISCSKKAVKNKTYCVYHINEHRKASKRYREKIKNEI